MPVLKLTRINLQLFVDVLILPLNNVNADQFSFHLQTDGTPTKSPHIFKALVDTGATSSCVSFDCAKKVGLAPIGKVSVQGVHGVMESNNYAFHVGFIQPVPAEEGQSAFEVNVLSQQITRTEVKSGGHFDVLLGMDVLTTGQLVCSGTDTFTFAF